MARAKTLSPVKAKKTVPPVEIATIQNVERYAILNPEYSELGKERKKIIKFFNDSGKSELEGIGYKVSTKITPTSKFNKDLAIELLTKLGATPKQIEACYVAGESCEWVVSEIE